MAVLNWTPQAITDLINISEFIGKDSSKYAIITINKIKMLAKKLTLQPYSGRKVPEINNNNVREIIFGNYRIIYKIHAINRIDILTIHHSARHFY